MVFFIGIVGGLWNIFGSGCRLFALIEQNNKIFKDIIIPPSSLWNSVVNFMYCWTKCFRVYCHLTFHMLSCNLSEIFMTHEDWLFLCLINIFSRKKEKEKTIRIQSQFLLPHKFKYSSLEMDHA